MKNILLFIITAMAHAIASLLGLRSWAKAKADVNLYLTEEDYSFMRMFPDGAALERCHAVSGKPEVWSPSGYELMRTESDWHPLVGHYSAKVHVPRPAGSGVMTSANVSVYPNKGVSNPELKPSIGRRKARFYMDREARQHIAEEIDAWTRKLDVSELIHRLKAGHKELTEEGIFCVAVATEGHFSSEVTPYPYEKHPDFDGCLDTACI